jgi:citrate lyase subunit beta/citryl-CoA lyase
MPTAAPYPPNFRSFLIVAPRFDPARAFATKADRIVIDLTSFQPGADEADILAHWQSSHPDRRPDVLLPTFASGNTEAAVALAVRLRATMILQSVTRGADVQRLDVLLRVKEAQHGSRRETGIVAILDEAGLMAASSLQRCSHRLTGLALQPADPMLDRQSDTARLRRAQLVLAARAANVLALDGPSPAEMPDEVRRECLDACRNGFSGALSRLESQVPVMNEVFEAAPQPETGRTSSKTSEPPSA